MSQENVEIVRSAFAALQEDGVEGVVPFLSDDLVLHDPDLPGGGTFSGPRGFVDFAAQVMASFREYSIELEELIDAEQKVVAFTHHRGLGDSSGASVDLRDAQVWSIDHGKAVRIDFFLDRSEAIAAAGLGR